MLVYGDAKRVEAVAAKVERLLGILSRIVFLDPGIERHAAFATLLIEAGELEQGLLDEQLQGSGEERLTPLSEAVGWLTRAAAGLFESSYRSCGSRPSELVEATAPVVLALEEILGLPLSGTVTVTVPEGYAFYGLYPETYLEAARRAPELGEGPVQVIGIRSIGTSLAAAVAAGVGDGAATVTVRPGGHPFSRTLALGEEMERRLLSSSDDGGEVRFAVADEGPGLSGSSFGSVADWLEERGVPSESISFFPSHRSGPGPYASERHRERWDRARRHTVDFEELFVSPGARWPLAGWVADLTGTAEGPLEDLSAGRWRERLFPDPSRRPPAHLQQERRKYLLAAGGRKWLLKFAGLGRYGREALELARTLEREGLVPPVAGLRHGFLVGPWLEEARPLPLVPDLDRAALLEQVASYLAFRAARLPAGPERRGAPPEKLLEMARFNVEKALGADAAEKLEAWEERLPDLTARERPILSDNRLHAWEWLVLPDGRILKADGLDHHRSNDLVGEQDVAWDLAGATIELELSVDEGERLREDVARRSGVVSTVEQLRFYTLAYLAFQLGACRLAAEALEGMDGEEAGRMRRAADRYAERLLRL